MATSALQKLQKKKEPKKVLMEKDFAGIKKGQLMLVATPQLIADYITRWLRNYRLTLSGSTFSVSLNRSCDAVCLVELINDIRYRRQYFQIRAR